jgi:predicted DNA-binding protein (MmcQ/YjbR family)
MNIKFSNPNILFLKRGDSQMGQFQSAPAQEIITKVRGITESFPEVVEHIDQFGHLSFRIKDKPFVIIGEDESPSLSIKTLKTTQALLLQKPEEFYKSPYIGHHGWTSVQTSQRINWEEINDYIREAYLQTAPKRIVKTFT